MSTTSLCDRVHRCRKTPMKAAERDALLAAIHAHRIRLEAQRARLQAAERLVAELVRLEGGTGR